MRDRGGLINITGCKMFASPFDPGSKMNTRSPGKMGRSCFWVFDLVGVGLIKAPSGQARP
jgi:hypothetical protein